MKNENEPLFAETISNDHICKIIKAVADTAVKIASAEINAADDAYRKKLLSLSPHRILICTIECMRETDLQKIRELKLAGIDLNAEIAKWREEHKDKQ